MLPVCPGAIFLSKLVVVQPHDGLTLLISSSALPSFFTLKVCFNGVPALIVPKECSNESKTSLGAAFCCAPTTIVAAAITKVIDIAFNLISCPPTENVGQEIKHLFSYYTFSRLVANQST